MWLSHAFCPKYRVQSQLITIFRLAQIHFTALKWIIKSVQRPWTGLWESIISANLHDLAVNGATMSLLPGSVHRRESKERMTLYLGAGMTKRMLRGLSTSDAAMREGLLTGRGSPLGLLLPLGDSGRESGFGDSTRGASQLRSPVVNPVGNTIRMLVQDLERFGSMPTASCTSLRHEPDDSPLFLEVSHQAGHCRKWGVPNLPLASALP